jgi:hypothetical protein
MPNQVLHDKLLTVIVGQQQTNLGDCRAVPFTSGVGIEFSQEVLDLSRRQGLATATIPSQKQAVDHGQRYGDVQQQCHGLGLPPNDEEQLAHRTAIDTTLKNADFKASPQHQRFLKGVVRSTNSFLTASSDMKIFLEDRGFWIASRHLSILLYFPYMNVCFYAILVFKVFFLIWSKSLGSYHPSF